MSEAAFPKQRTLLRRVDAQVLDAAVQCFPDTPAARSWLQSSACVESSAWMANAGLKSHPHNFTNSLFKTALQLKLMQPAVLVRSDQAMRCICDDFDGTTPLEVMVHALGCPKLSELRTARHNALRDRLAKLLTGMRHGAHVDTEVDLARVDDDRAHNGDRLRSDVRWLLGNEVVHFDTSVVSPVSRRALALHSATQAGVAAEEAQRMKRRQYQAALTAEGLALDALQPVVFETTGRKGSEFKTTEAWLREKYTEAGVGALEADIYIRRFVAGCTTDIWKFNCLMIQAVARSDTAIFEVVP